MQRALAPKRQVTEIARFVRECGGTPKHSEVLELVARLNGAANWNALKAPPLEAAAPAVQPPGAAGVRVVDRENTKAVFIGTTMFEESEPWFLMAPVGQGNFERERELEDDELEALMSLGVVVEAQVLHPRTDRYGLPDVALREGLFDWLHNEQSLSTCDAGEFELFSFDSGDDAPATCALTVRVPRTVMIR